MGKLEDLQQQTEQIEKQMKLIAQKDANGEARDEQVIKNFKLLIKEQEKQIKLYKEKTGHNEDEAKSMEASIKNAKRLLKVYKEQFTAIGLITQRISVAGAEFTKFLKNTGAQLQMSEEIARVYNRLGKNIGMTGKSAKQMHDSFKGALPSVVEMGMTYEDLETVYQNISEATGRISTLTDKDAIRVAAMSESMNLSASQAAEMGEAFILMGNSTAKMEEHILETYKSAQSMGLNATKVIQVLQSKMKVMQEYSFAGGVKGMTSMAKQAVKMRLDVSEVLGMADKFYQPEAAIEAAANLQMLGGDIAEAFGDPFETMYLARNKPEELAKKLGKMTENMMQFNEETGEYEFPAEVRMQLKAAGEQLGINVGSMIEMARQTSKIKDIKMKFTSIGDDDMRENLASLARYSEESGEFVVQHNGEELGLDSITDGMAEEIMKENQTSDENLSDIAINTKTMSDQIANFRKAADVEVATTTNIYELTAAQMEGPFKQMKAGIGKLADQYIEKSGKFLDDMFKDPKLTKPFFL